MFLVVFGVPSHYHRFSVMKRVIFVIYGPWGVECVIFEIVGAIWGLSCLIWKICGSIGAIQGLNCVIWGICGSIGGIQHCGACIPAYICCLGGTCCSMCFS